MTVYFSDNLFDFLYNLEFFIFHFLLLFFSNCYQGNLSQIGEPRTAGLKVNLVSDGQTDFIFILSEKCDKPTG